ncbi:MAG TPA: CsbD family protein [Rhodanobacteraceae bacterium]|nr:CsbD family protein [Rhodanobacteraceae bacterium]
MSNDRIMEQWTNISDRLRRRWRKLTNEDVRCPDGSSKYLAEKLQQRYGVDRHEAFLQVYEFESEL